VTEAGLVEYVGASEVEGPLLVVSGVDGVGWDEFATIRLPSGERREGLVLEVHGDVAVVQVLEGSSGIDPRSVSVSFTGRPFQIPVGEGWLGRVWNGLGAPLDGGPPMLGGDPRPVSGAPMNPTVRDVPSDPVLTGVSIIDAFTTLVRGQKLPIFSAAGLPHLELAAQIAAQSQAGGEPFKVVFAAMGLTHTDASAVEAVLEERADAGDLALFVNTSDDPVVSRILTPRVALTLAEYLAFDLGQHVLVVLADMTSYCEAVREVSAARGEIPGRRAYPGYLYSDLASIYERCGRIRGRPGSVTLMPVLTMPGGDITHPVPDLTGYITEGQIVLSAELQASGVYPPVDLLSSLSRLMRKGAGPGRTRDDHLEIAAQLIAATAHAREVRDLAELIGEDSLTGPDRCYLAFERALEMTLMNQPRSQSRSLEETLDLAWMVASELPRRELTMVSAATLLKRYVGDAAASQPPPDTKAAVETATPRAAANRPDEGRSR